MSIELEMNTDKHEMNMASTKARVLAKFRDASN